MGAISNSKKHKECNKGGTGWAGVWQSDAGMQPASKASGRPGHGMTSHGQGPALM